MFYSSFLIQGSIVFFCGCKYVYFAIYSYSYNTLVPWLKFLTLTLRSQMKMFFGECSNLNDYPNIFIRKTLAFP